MSPSSPGQKIHNVGHLELTRTWKTPLFESLDGTGITGDITVTDGVWRMEESRNTCLLSPMAGFQQELAIYTSHSM